MLDLSIGIDIVSIERMENILNSQKGARFKHRIFTVPEISYCQNRANSSHHFAGRFAAKEAIVKAMGTGFSQGIWVRDVGMMPNDWGQPQIIYSERGQIMRERLGIGSGHLTLSDEAGLIIAVAILMKAD